MAKYPRRSEDASSQLETLRFVGVIVGVGVALPETNSIALSDSAFSSRSELIDTIRHELVHFGTIYPLSRQ
jgi:hypothetical protein